VLQDSFKGMNLGTLYLVFKDLGGQSMIVGFPALPVKTFSVFQAPLRHPLVGRALPVSFHRPLRRIESSGGWEL
jgi:hypothetical protein